MASSFVVLLTEGVVHAELRWRVRPVLLGCFARTDDRVLETADACLRRVLALAREGRRVSAFHQPEALAGVARSVIETTIIGLRTLAVEDDSWDLRLQKQNATYGRRTLASLDPRGIVTDMILGDSLDDAPGMPNLRQSAEDVDAHLTFGGEPVAVRLYERYHLPLSNLSVHTTLAGLSLYRSPWGHRRRRPISPVPRRGLVRCIEACTAFLAAAVSNRRALDPSWFVAHGLDQLRRSNDPVAIGALRIALRAVPAHAVAALLSAELRSDIAALIRLLWSEEFRQASQEEQDQLFGQAVRDMTSPRNVEDA